MSLNISPIIKTFDRLTGDLTNVIDPKWIKSFSFTLDLDGGCKEFQFELLKPPQNYIDGYDKVLIYIDPDAPPVFVGEINRIPMSNAGHYTEPAIEVIEDFEDGAADVANWTTLGASVTPPPPTPSASLATYGPNAGLICPASTGEGSASYSLQISGFANFDELLDNILIYRNLATPLDLTGRGVAMWIAHIRNASAYSWYLMQIRLYSNQGTADEDYILKEFGPVVNSKLWDTSHYDWNVLYLDELNNDGTGGAGKFDISKIDRIGLYLARGLGAVPTDSIYLDFCYSFPSAKIIPADLQYKSTKLQYSGYGMVGCLSQETYWGTHTDTNPAVVFETAAGASWFIDDTDSDAVYRTNTFIYRGATMDQVLKEAVEIAANHYWIVGQNQNVAYKNTPRVLCEMRLLPTDPEYFWQEGDHFDGFVDAYIDFTKLNNSASLRVGKVVRAGYGNYATYCPFPPSCLAFGLRTKSANLSGINDTEPRYLTNAAYGVARANGYPVYDVKNLQLNYIDDIVWPARRARIFSGQAYFDVRIMSVSYSWSQDAGLVVSPTFGEASRGGPLFTQVKNLWRSIAGAKEMIDRNV